MFVVQRAVSCALLLAILGTNGCSAQSSDRAQTPGPEDADGSDVVAGEDGGSGEDANAETGFGPEDAFVTAFVDDGIYPGLVVDGRGKAHMVYYHPADDAVRYATDASGTWTRESLFKVSSPGVEYTLPAKPAIAVDSSGKPHISYFQLSPASVKGLAIHSLIYATNASGEWNRRLVLSSQYTGRTSSIALDSRGKPYIASPWTNCPRRQDYPDVVFCDASVTLFSPGLAKIPAIWNSHSIHDADSFDVQLSIAIDADDQIHMGSCPWGGTWLNYTTNTSGKWKTDKLLATASYGGQGHVPSIVVDSIARPYIVYLGRSYFELTGLTDQGWKTTVTEDCYPNLAVGPGDVLNQLCSGSVRRYATDVFGRVTGTVDSPAIRRGPLAIDRENRIHIAAYDSKKKTVSYITNR